ncbi:extracellular solute-binding protein [Thalassotalea sp. 1_MG-2023]|uniref:ABC transporter substrate-binding protein n=1 Tax=Thalassotalea sp. 1_MG-2023 TaxID=3062680 RepID=UPI0026E3C581|nr:extracellular solute-binding protein [Thalassotalea sp. 1_MG-2023]MDO6427291.1 extracellular solute-binding protein [Thalassotalea sp. 1_MG-2023]
MLAIAGSSQAENNIINFAALTHSDQQEVVLRQQISLFERLNPQIKVRLRMLHGENYPELLTNYKKVANNVDVLNWYSGNRLKQLVKEQYVTSIDEFWYNNNLHAVFSDATIEQVSIQDKVYAVPFSMYVWEVFYKKSVFEKFGLTSPTNWQDFMSMASTLKSHNIKPIGLGSEPPWQVVAWFDYLMLRINGAKHYKALVSGNLAFTSPEVVSVFTHWKQLLDQDLFNDNHHLYNGEEIMPLVYREIVGVNLSGSISLSGLPKYVQDDIASFSFPQVGKYKDNSILAPMSAIALTQKGKLKPASKTLMAFFSQYNTQKMLNDAMQTISPILSTENNHSALVDDIHSADQIFQFLDREMSFEMAEFSKRTMADFLKHQNIKKVTESLEAFRLQQKEQQ